MAYISTDDIKANIADGFNLQPYLEEADSEIIDVAEQVGVYNIDDIKTNPLHYKIKRYAVTFVLYRLCQDKMGTNNVALDELEKYTMLFGIYKKEYEGLRTEITSQMVTGNVNEMRDRATIGTGLIFRS